MNSYYRHLVQSCLGILLLLPICTFAQTPSSPFGQSNTFALNTNRVGFGNSTVLYLSNSPEMDAFSPVISLGTLLPNPFNPRINISFEVGQAGSVQLSIYDLAGHCVKNLVESELAIGRYSRTWDGRNDSGSSLPTGVYLVRIKSRNSTESQKITLVK